MSRSNGQSEVGILGAGIIGSCLALELAQRGKKVALIDLAPTPMTGASLHNEGKLHLGFVYAKDPSKETHRLMAQGALSFSRIIEKLTGKRPEELLPAKPFFYYVPYDSQLSMEAIVKHFQDVDVTIQQAIQETGDHYLGRRYERYFEQTSPSEHAAMFSPEFTLGSLRTEELSVSPVAVANIITQAIKDQPNITFTGNTRVIAANMLSGNEVEVELMHDGKRTSKTYPFVTNCLWDDKLRIDTTAGVRDRSPYMLRYKATITISAPTVSIGSIPSATGILGSYGDIVNHDNGTYYVSWYPLCMLAQSVDDNGRRLHDLVHKTPFRNIRKMLANFPATASFVASITHARFIRKSIKAMAAYIPSMRELISKGDSYKVGGGVILARGATDIDDPSSYLHQRSKVGPVAHGPFISIDTGKYCTAPMFALQAADMITDRLK